MIARNMIRVAAVAAMAVMGQAAPSFGGTYDVLACGGGPNHTWRKDVTHGGMAAYPDPPTCDGTGLVARHVGQPQGWTVPSGAAARWWFDAPAGTSIVGVAMKARFDTKDRRWQAGLSNGYQLLRGCLPGRDSCAVDLDGSYFDVPSSGFIFTEAFCPAGPCPAYWQNDGFFGNVFGRAIIYSALVRIADWTAPGVSGGRGPAWSDGWIGGTKLVTFDASDNSGIAGVSTAIDGKESSRVVRSCDAYARACPDWSDATLEVNTRAVQDGSHRLGLYAVDRAGNSGSQERDIKIDNTPPSAPLDLAVVGAAWRSTAAVGLTWRNPGQEFAPIAGAEIEMCPVGEAAACTTISRDGPDLSSADIELPRPGAWDVRVWLRDAAGNATRENAAPPLTLGLDAVPPEDVAFRPIDPENPSLVHVRASDSLSGIAGGEIELRRFGRESWRSLKTRVVDGGLGADLPDSRLADGNYLLRARVWDRAHNERSTQNRTDGSPAELTLPVRVKTRMLVGRPKRVRARSARGHRRMRTIYVRRPVVRHGRRAHLGGRLVAPGGNALAGVPVEVSARLDQPGAAFTPVATLTTGRSGRFSYFLPAGPSRVVRFFYSGAPKIRAQARKVRVRVRAWSTLRVDRHFVVTGDAVTFRGRLRTLPLPAEGKLVELQYLDRGEWRTFRTLRAAASTRRWSYTYRFTGTAGRRTYRFRARVPRENSYPYAPGASNSVRVTVQGL